MGGEPYLTLLFYNYVTISEPSKLVEVQKALCTDLSLVGRLRIAEEGVNGCFGGTPENIEKYITIVESDPRFLPYFQNVDWKRGAPRKDKSVDEQRMVGLIVKAVPELCSFGLANTIPEGATGGRHASPEEFHEMLMSANKDGTDGAAQQVGGESAGSDSKGIALIDVRNRYETAIGYFSAENVMRVDPMTRQFSDFASSISRPETLDKLKDKKVLMYCTGGVRCERASAFLKSKGVDDVYQLKGGIHRYLEKYPDGGFWKGKNFVFDRRLAVGAAEPAKDAGETSSPDAGIVGSCLLCSGPCDDYGPGMRCVHCRLLVLVCESCRGDSGNGQGGKTEDGAAPPKLHADRLVCEACMEERNCYERRGDELPRYLHVLCLHDGNSNARIMQHFLRRTSRKLRKMVRFHYVEAPFLSTVAQNLSSTSSKRRRLERRAWSEGDGSDGQYPGAKERLKKFILERKERTEQYNGAKESLEKEEDSEMALLGRIYQFDGILGVGEGSAVVESLSEKDVRELSFKFGCTMKFYPVEKNAKVAADSLANNTEISRESSICKMYSNDWPRLNVPIPANSSHLKDTAALQALRSFFSERLFEHPLSKVDGEKANSGAV